MKTARHSIILLALAVFSFSGLTYGQTVHLITLHVDEDGAFSFSAGPETEVIDDSSPEAFTILVFEDDEIEWEGESATGAAVEIEKIKFPHSSKPFKNKDLFGKRQNGKKKAKGKIAKGKKNKTYKYDIDFTVDGEDFTIDPGIRVSQ